MASSNELLKLGMP